MNTKTPDFGAASALADQAPPGRLQRDLEYLPQVLDATPVGSAVWSIERRLVYANPVLRTLLGRPADELSGMLLDDLLVPADAGVVLAMLAELWEGRRNHIECNLRAHRPDGEDMQVRCYLAAVYGADGRPGYLISQVFSFAGPQSRGELLHRLAHNTPAMIWLTDESGYPRLGNRMCFDFVGVHRPSGELGRVWADAVHPDDLAAAVPRIQGRIDAHQPFEFVARSRRRDGVWRWLHHRAQPIFGATGAFEGYAGASLDVTESERARRDLRDSQQLFAEIAEAGPLAVLRTDADGKVTYFNGRWAEFLPDHESRLADFSWQDMLAADYVDRITAAAEESVSSRRPFRLRVRAHDPSTAPGVRASTEFWGDLRGAPIFATDGEHVGFTATLIDVTTSVMATERADRLAQVLDASSDLVLLTLPTGAITYANDAARQLLDITIAPDQLHGTYLWDLLDRESAEVYYDVVETMIGADGVWRGNLVFRARDGGLVPVSALFLGHRDEFGRVDSISAVARDITELKDAELRLRHLATHDALTGRPNRALLYDRLDLARARHHRLGHGGALLFCDLDRFKPDNDEFGHDHGDAVLRDIARRIGVVIRETDTAARVGGDEFVVLVEGVDDLDLLRGVADRLLESISQPIEIGFDTAQVGVSIGLVVANAGRDDVDTLMRLADRTMYQAKAAGRGRVAFYDGEW
jgi:diguanylate cyclase (GGDEF)-like protein/PAS domain S-box-containing protein